MASQIITYTNKSGKQFPVLNIFDDNTKYRHFYLGYKKSKLVLEHLTDIKLFIKNIEEQPPITP